MNLYQIVSCAALFILTAAFMVVARTDPEAAYILPWAYILPLGLLFLAGLIIYDAYFTH